MKKEICEHVKSVAKVNKGDKNVCEECIKHDGKWVHLRTCQTCGITLCCDSSPGMHMTKHFHVTGHPVSASAEPGEQWMWCFIDEVFAKY